ncbi:MAG: hypothetical protein HQ522_16620 [Bacteroidetes bacterium]|nr:hypothetical protein [Bacteroidota bacterium]
MNWQDFGIPGIIILIAGTFFLWYQRLTSASIRNVNSKCDLLEARNKELKITYEKKISELTSHYNSTKYQDYYPDEEEIKQLKSLMQLFDRRALTVSGCIDLKSWGGIGLMINSLNDLRIQLQSKGVSLLKSPYLKERFNFIKADIENIVDYTIIYYDYPHKHLNIEIDTIIEIKIREKVDQINTYLHNTSEFFFESMHINLDKPEIKQASIDLFKSLRSIYFTGIIDEFHYRTNSHLRDIEKLL